MDIKCLQYVIEVKVWTESMISPSKSSFDASARMPVFSHSCDSLTRSFIQKSQCPVFLVVPKLSMATLRSPWNVLVCIPMTTPQSEASKTTLESHPSKAGPAGSMPWHLDKTWPLLRTNFPVSPQI